MIQCTVSGQLVSIDKLDLGLEMATENMYQATVGIVKNQEDRSAGHIMWVVVALVVLFIILVITGL